ncbi:replicative helicase loader/inhibitor [Clostridium sp.]|uniref:replicative helicase loader/inhibitor n=1 Tax=Clostridium sp. TaxID=1506 RepID=UPI0032176F99
MTKNETIKLLTLLSSNYKSIDDKLKDRDKAKMLLETWFECLEDLDFNLCMIAAKKAIMSSSYPPTIHEIRKAATEIVTPASENTSAIELWNEAYKMITRGSYMTEDDFEKHSEVVKRFFGSVGQVKELARSELSIVNTVTKGQFLKQIEVLQTRKKEQDLLPASMRETINQIANNVQAKQIEGE